MSSPYIIISVIFAYFILWLSLSYFSSKGADNDTFFSANRKMPWPLVAIAMIGAPISGVTFVSVPGMVMGKSLSYLQMGLGFIAGYFVIAFVLIPLYYKLNIISIYGYLRERFGVTSYKTGAWLFFISKIFGISIRFLMVCAMLQLLIFDPLGISYIYCVIVSLALVWLSTFKGGIKSVVWGDILKSFFLLGAIILTIIFVISALPQEIHDLPDKIYNHPASRVFFFDDPSDARYFWKQFIAGIFIVIAMTGLDQDMMQRALTCKNAKDSRKNLIVSTFLQFGIILLLLILGILLLIYSESKGIVLPEKSDNLFAMVAFHSDIPLIVGILFIVGIIAATLSSVASALTSMTTTMSLDIMGMEKGRDDKKFVWKRRLVHSLITLLIATLVLFFYYLNRDDAISTVYTLISYTDGPILGLFAFGLLTNRKINENFLPAVCLSAPVIAWSFQWFARNYFGYEISFELLIINALLTFIGLSFFSGQKADMSFINTSLKFGKK